MPIVACREGGEAELRPCRANGLTDPILESTLASGVAMRRLLEPSVISSRVARCARPIAHPIARATRIRPGASRFDALAPRRDRAEPFVRARSSAARPLESNPRRSVLRAGSSSSAATRRASLAPTRRFLIPLWGVSFAPEVGMQTQVSILHHDYPTHVRE